MPPQKPKIHRDATDASADPLHEEELGLYGRTAAAGSGNRIVGRDDKRIGDQFERGTNERRNEKRMTERRAGSLGVRGTEGAIGVAEPCRNTARHAAQFRDVAELVNHRALLHHHEQQPEADDGG